MRCGMLLPECCRVASPDCASMLTPSLPLNATAPMKVFLSRRYLGTGLVLNTFSLHPTCALITLLLARATECLVVSDAHQVRLETHTAHRGRQTVLAPSQILGLRPWPYSLLQGLTCSADMLKHILQHSSSEAACLSLSEPAAQ